ncbi:MAG: FtsX-like permease family protein [Paludibacteraceae bacterium]|nr:FtsX-like permease family protein [Paludibacteraceae bacterium]
MKSYLNFLSRNKLYAAIEVLGISIALAFIIPLVSYVSDLWTVNHENRDYDRIYAFTFYPKYLAGCFDQPEFLKTNIPEVEETTLFSATRPADIKVGTESYSIELLLCDLNYFDFIPTRFIKGNREVLRDNTAALVSEAFARKIGYGRDAVGKTFVLDNLEYTIEGIIADYERSIMLPHDVVINIAGPTLQYYWDHPQRMHHKDFCLFRVAPGTDREALLAKIHEAAEVQYSAIYGFDEQQQHSVKDFMQLVRYDELTSANSSSLTHVNATIFKEMTVLSLLLLIFAIFNYIALNVALGTFRAREMATRRLLGASRAGIILKLLAESLLMTTVCFALGLLLSYAVMPVFNEVFRVAQLGFDMRIAFTWQNVCIYVLLILIVSAIAGLVPALILSRFKPIDVVKGELRSRNKMVFSKVFIFIQCFITMALLVASFVYAAQYRKMVNLPLGVDATDVYYLYGPYAHHELDPAVDALKQLPCVEQVGKCDDHPGMLYEWVTIPTEDSEEWEAVNAAGEHAVMQGGLTSKKCICTREAFEVYAFTIVRDFHREGEKVAWLTEGLVEQLHLNPADPQLTEEQMQRMGVTTVGGIVKDFRGSFYRDDPCFVSVQEDWFESMTAYYKSLAIKTIGNHSAAEKAILECMHKTLDEAWGVYKEPHLKGYVNDLNRESLRAERVLMITITLFSALMLILSLLGLMGLSTWFVSLKQHDIAVRKVFGATVADETRKNIRGYMIVVVAACLTAIPFSFRAAEQILSTYAHRITLSPLIFIAALLLICAVSAAVTALQTLRVTRMNPAVVLKKE